MSFPYSVCSYIIQVINLACKIFKNFTPHNIRQQIDDKRARLHIEKHFKALERNRCCLTLKDYAIILILSIKYIVKLKYVLLFKCTLVIKFK